MIREILGRGIHSLIPGKPSSGLEDFVDSIRTGKSVEVPTHGREYCVFDYYGKDFLGDEKARFRIPWGDYLEKSYHIRRTRQGEVIVTDEGILPSDL